MDMFTNFLISSLVPVVIWAIGAAYIHFTGPDTMRYIQWLKISAILYFFISGAASLALFALFPSPADTALLNGLTGGSLTGGSGVSSTPGATSSPGAGDDGLGSLGGLSGLGG